MLTRKSIMQKTVQVAGSTLLSRFLGVIREVLTVYYMGASALSDAFFTAWKVPNFLRKIFAEGALSAAFVPTIVQSVRSTGRQSIGSMMSLGFIVFESMVLVICVITIGFADPFIAFIAPGFSAFQVIQAANFLRILMPFIFFISTSALLAGPLQAIGHFFIPAFGQVLINGVYIIGLVICFIFSLPVTVLCWFILCGGLVQLLAHFAAFWRLQFRFGVVQKKDIVSFGPILAKFALCMVSMCVVEIGLFIDTSFASLLEEGSVSLLYYANRFMGIPLGVFAVAFSTILLPHFSRVSAYAPRRLGFYLLEATKLVWWVTIPIVGMMVLFSHKLFSTIFLSEKFTLFQVNQTASILIAFLAGLFFFAINKILLNVYYALHHTLIPGIIAIVSVCCNTFLNWVLIDVWKAVGLAIATTLAGILQTILLFGVLYYWVQLPLYFASLLQFILRYTVQLILFGLPSIMVYGMAQWIIAAYSSEYMQYILLNTIVFWVWVIPLCLLFMTALYTTRHFFGVRIIFFEKE